MPRRGQAWRTRVARRVPENQEKPTFTFEQLLLRFGVGVIILVLFVTAVELDRVRGRVQELETGARRLQPRPPPTRWARLSRSSSC